MTLKNCDIQTLLNRIKSEKLKLIVFGAGKQLTEACGFFSCFGFFECIYAIADNKQRTFRWRDKTKDVSPPATTFENIISEEVIIYISTSYYPEIYEQLEQLEQLATVPCYIHEYVMHMPLPYSFPISPTEAVHKIPKKIHYCWFGGNEIPKQNRIWMESWRTYCPEYEIIRWDESNYDVSKNPYMYAAYKEKKWAFVSDYARLDIVYEQGGVYLDNDVELLKNIDSLLVDEAFCGFSSLNYVNFGLGFGAIQKFWLLSEMKERYNSASFYNDDGTLNLTRDCGYYQTDILDKYGLKHENKPQLIAGVRVYSTDVLSPMDTWCNKLAFTSNSYSVHHYDASWFDNNEACRRKEGLCRYKKFIDTHTFEV